MRSRYVLMLALLMFLSISANIAVAEQGDIVYVLQLQDAIEPGLAKFIERVYGEAEQMGVKLILIEMDTPGGRIDAALDIRDIIMSASFPTATLVKDDAISAGSFIALSSKYIAMEPGTSIGDAEPRIGSKKADEKTVSYWTSKMKDTAEANGRNGEIAAAMADSDISIPGVVEKGKLLTLTYQKALELNMIDYVVNDRTEFLEKMGFANSNIIEVKPTIAENLARFFTNPFISPLLLTIGIAGLVVEFLTIGWGVAGTVGLASLAAFFGGHLVAGLTGWESVLLFVVGIIFLVVEMLVFPGFGVAGVIGLVSIGASIILVTDSITTAISSLTISLIGTIIIVAFSLRFLTKRGFWSKIILGFKQNKDSGYNSPQIGMEQFLGHLGITITILRPAGTIELADGRRLDVVTNGEFIASGRKVKIVKVEGGRIIVQENK